MIDKAVLVLAASLVGGFGSSVVAEEMLGTQVGRFRCLAKQQVPDFEVKKAGIRIGSISISERKSPVHGNNSRIEIAFAVANQQDKDLFVVGQFILMTEGSIAAAITAEPDYQRVRAGTTDVAKGSIFAAPGTLEKVTGVCINF